jgi:hypothetical protein
MQIISKLRLNVTEKQQQLKICIPLFLLTLFLFYILEILRYLKLR